MAIVLTCVCGGKLGVDDALAGKQARCPACARVVDVPLPVASDAPHATQPAQGPSVPAAPPEDAERLLIHEAHIKSIAYWHCVIGGASGLLLLWPLAEALEPGNRGGWAGLVIALCVVGEVVSGIVFLFGWGLGRYLGWARWGIVVAAMGYIVLAFTRVWDTDRPEDIAVFMAPMVWCFGVLQALVWPAAGQICSQQHREWVARRGDVAIRPWRSHLFYAPVVLIAVVVLLDLAFGWSL